MTNAFSGEKWTREKLRILAAIVGAQGYNLDKLQHPERLEKIDSLMAAIRDVMMEQDGLRPIALPQKHFRGYSMSIVNFDTHFGPS